MQVHPLRLRSMRLVQKKKGGLERRRSHVEDFAYDEDRERDVFVAVRSLRSDPNFLTDTLRFVLTRTTS